MADQVVWVALRVVYPPELLGVFNKENNAVAACQQPIDVVGPIVVDQVLPDERVDWPGCYYPLANDAQPTTDDV